MFDLHFNKKIINYSKRLALLFFLIIIFILFYMPALAHKVSIFAWIEGDTVYTQSKFSKGKRVKNMPVIVYDMEENKLIEGKTNNKGEFNFKIPKKTSLRIVLKASMGHMAEWKIPFESDNVESNFKGSDETELHSKTNVSEMNLPVSSDSNVMSREEIKKLIDETINRKLADSYGKNPRLSEIIGGIGYIVGLMGLAMYCSISNKKK